MQTIFELFTIFSQKITACKDLKQTSGLIYSEFCHLLGYNLPPDYFQRVFQYA